MKSEERELSIFDSFLKVVLKFRSTRQIVRGIELDVESYMSYRIREFLTLNLHLPFLPP